MADNSLKALTTKIVQIAEDTNQSIKPDVHAIKEAIVGPDGILKSITYVSKQLDNLQKKGTLSKLTNKPLDSRKTAIKINTINTTLNKILNQMQRMSRGGGRLGTGGIQRDTTVKNNRLGSIYQSIEIIQQLRNIKLKDFIFAKTKLKHISKIMSRALSSFKMFKNKKEMEDTMSFVSSSIDLMKKLSKVFWISKPAQWGVNAIEKIFLGGGKLKDGGLLGLFRKVDRNKKTIKNGKKSMKDMLKACGSMLLTSIILTGIAAVAVPAMLGALLMKGVIWLLTGTFVGLSKVAKPVKKGSMVMLLMSASIISFALGLGLMLKAVKNMKLKDVGLMMASIAGVGLTVAGVGLLAAPIALGSASLLLLGASLGIFGVVIDAWRSLDVKPAMGNIKEAVGGLREIFGLELGKGDSKKTIFQRIGGGIMDFAMGVLNFGSSFFIMGQLLLAAAALGALYKGLKPWDNFNGIKAAKNLKIGIGAVKAAFGIEDKKDKKESLKGKIKKLGGKILDMGISLLQGGKTLAEMATITIATGMADVIRLTLIPWNKFDAKPAAKNLKEAFGALKDAFGLNDRNNENLGQKTLRLFGGALDMASTLLSSGGVMVKMGTIMLATGLADIIKLNLKPWENYDGVNATENMAKTINSLKSVFGLEDNPGGFKIGKIAGGILDLGISLLQSGGTFVKMGTIAMATGFAEKIRENIVPWENYTGGKKAIENMKNTVNDLLNLFDLDNLDEAKKKKGLLDWISKVGKAIGSAIEGTTEAVQGGGILAQINAIASIVKAFTPIRESLEPWKNFNSEPSLSNLTNTINGLLSEIISVHKLDGAGYFDYFEKSTKNIKKGIKHLTKAFNINKNLKEFSVPFKSTVDTINALDITKASTVIEIFKSFSGVKKKPIDAFTKAVDKFSQSCTDLIDSLNKFEGSNVQVTSNNESSSTEATPTNYTVDINNTSDLATAIANAIRQLPINVESNMSDVRLVVNNETGRRVILTLDN